MRISPEIRIQWFHEQVVRETYPNAARIADRFHISARQAQRDIDYLKNKMNAPLVFDSHRQGYTYTEPFSIPSATITENDETFTRLPSNPLSPGSDEGMMGADNVVIQSQLPFTAILDIDRKLTVLELRSFIISDEGHGRFVCEFHNTDRFLCSILLARTGGVRIEEPEWLRNKLVAMAERVLDANRPENDAKTRGRQRKKKEPEG